MVSACYLAIAYFYMQWDHWSDTFHSGMQCIELRRKHGLGPWLIPLMLARLHAARGDVEKSEKWQLDTLNERQDLDPRMTSYMMALVSMARRDYATARQILGEALTIALSSITSDYAIYPYLAECAARTGDEATALHYATLAEEVARRGGGKPWLALALRAQGLVYTQREEWEQALPCLQEAVALFRGMGCRWEEGRTLVDLAHLYRRRGEGGDRERAWQHYQDALGHFEGLWAIPDVERVQQEMLDL
jgi:tetratricopeptide (TPR) repeat protein